MASDLGHATSPRSRILRGRYRLGMGCGDPRCPGFETCHRTSACDPEHRAANEVPRKRPGRSEPTPSQREHHPHESFSRHRSPRSVLPCSRRPNRALDHPSSRNGAPGFESRKDIPEQAQDTGVNNVNNPSITVFLPPKDRATGAAVVIAPGGGFRELVFDAEGRQAAEFLNSIGVAAFAPQIPAARRTQFSLHHAPACARMPTAPCALVRSPRHRVEHRPASRDMLGSLRWRRHCFAHRLHARRWRPIRARSHRPPQRQARLSRCWFIRAATSLAPFPKGSPQALSPGCQRQDDYGCDKVTLNLYEKLRDAQVPRRGHF